MADTRNESATHSEIGGRMQVRERKRKRACDSNPKAGSRTKKMASMHSGLHHRNNHGAGTLQPTKERGHCVGTSACWGTLCPDLRGHILGKLSLREHASAAPVCREFLEEFVNRVAKERAASISFAERTIGKVVFNAFVTAYQRLMCGLPLYPDCPQPSASEVIIDATGKIKPVTQQMENGVEAFTMLTVEGGAYIETFALNGSVMWPIPGRSKTTWISVEDTAGPHNSLSVEASWQMKEASVVARGLMMAICTGNPAATAAHWQRPLREIVLADEELRHERRERGTNAGSELPASLGIESRMDCVYYGSGLDLEGESARGRRARCRAAAHAVAAAGKKGAGSEWHGECLGLCAFLLDNPTAGTGPRADVGAGSRG